MAEETPANTSTDAVQEPQTDAAPGSGLPLEAPALEKKAPSSTLAIVSFSLGVASVPTVCIGVGVVLGIAAVALGIVALVQIGKGEAKGKAMAIAGICTGSLCGLCLALLIFAGMLLPALNNAREKARRISCESNLRAIGTALKQYAAENDGSLPPGKGVAGFETLRRSGCLDARFLVCPSSSLRQLLEGAQLSEECVSYVYLGAETKDGKGEASETVIVAEKAGNHSGFVCKLYLDGHVEGED